ncbi:rhodanese-like domain-containing protein [Marinomonas agarivorans]|nr:rhodanese-like domain-containing protein [Marinomonas agarivorans]
MIDQIIEFSTNHWEMVGLFLLLLTLVFWVESKGAASSLTPASATALINTQDAVVLDIRPAAEYKTGYITDAINVPATTLKDSLGKLEKHKEKPVIVVCKTGMASGAAAKELQKNGFTSVYKMKGGIAEWQASNLPLVKG